MALEPTRMDRAAGYRLLDVPQDEATRNAALPGLDATVPGFAGWIVTALFGGTYQRADLPLRDRRLVDPAALTALGDVDPQLTGHARTGLRVATAALDTPAPTPTAAPASASGAAPRGEGAPR